MSQDPIFDQRRKSTSVSSFHNSEISMVKSTTHHHQSYSEFRYRPSSNLSFDEAVEKVFVEDKDLLRKLAE